MKLLQVSDPHFGTERPEVVEALLALAHAERPDVLVLSGDVTQRARRAQFDAARRFVERLRVPAVLAVPGNHDIPLFNLWARLTDPYGAWARCFGRDLEPVLERDDALVVGVNTTRWWRHRHGAVSAAQVERVAARLRAARRQQLRVVVTHQPLHVIRPWDEANRLRGHAAALAAWSGAGADVVLGGHIHLAHVQHVGGLWSVNAGTAVSSRVRHGRSNSVNLVRSAGRSASVERWDCDAARGFVCVEATPIGR